MNDIKADNRQAFFPKDKIIAPERPISESKSKVKIGKKKESENSSFEGDAKVEIPHKIKEYSKIKRAVDNAPNIDKSDKINLLKKKIDDGEYEMRVDEIAKKMLSGDF